MLLTLPPSLSPYLGYMYLMERGEGMELCYRAWYRVEWWVREGHLSHLCGRKGAINRGVKRVISFDKNLSLSSSKSPKLSPSLAFFCSQSSNKNSPKTATKTAQKPAATAAFSSQKTLFFPLNSPQTFLQSIYKKKVPFSCLNSSKKPIERVKGWSRTRS